MGRVERLYRRIAGILLIIIFSVVTTASLGGCGGALYYPNDQDTTEYPFDLTQVAQGVYQFVDTDAQVICYILNTFQKGPVSISCVPLSLQPTVVLPTVVLPTLPTLRSFSIHGSGLVDKARSCMLSQSCTSEPTLFFAQP